MKKISWIVAGLGLLALAGTSAQAQGPTVQLLGTFDYPGTGNLTRPQKVNDPGDIVGEFVDSTGVIRGFVLSRTGQFSQPIVDPNDMANETEGRGINNSSLVCGDYLDASLASFHGFFLMGHTFTNFDLPDATSTINLGLNNAADFCGSVIPTGGAQEAFISIGGNVTEFQVQNATVSLAYQINDADQSCGYWIDANGVDHGFYRDAGGTIHSPIDPPGSTGTILFGNNNVNQIVGRYSDSSGLTHGLIFLPPNRLITYDYPGSAFTSLNGINNQGKIVGRYIDNSGIEHGIVLRLLHGGADAKEQLLPQTPAATQPRGMPMRGEDVVPAS